jgi:TolB-like protein
VVVPFENRTGDPAADDWAFVAAEYITRGIDRASVVTVVPASVVRDLVREVDPAVGMPLEEIARRTGARYAVAGSYSFSAGRLRFDVELVDAASGDMLRALDPVAGPADSLEVVSALLAERVTAATMALLSPELDPVFAQWSSPPSLDVIRSLLATGDLFCRARWQDVIDQAQPVLQKYPDFAPLLIQVVFSYVNLGRILEADSVIALIEPHFDRLTTSERLIVEWVRGLIYGDRAEETRAVEQLFRIQRGNFGYHAGWTALQANRFADALERLLAQDLDTPCYRVWFRWWLQTAEAYHMLGRYEEELDVARDGRERFPSIRPLIYFEAAALVGLGRMDAVDSLLAVIVDLPVQPGSSHATTSTGIASRMSAASPGLQTAFIALELKVLGDHDAYKAVMERSLAWFAARPSNELRDHRGRAFYYGERWSDADTLFAALSVEAPADLDYRGYRGVALAHLGRREEALESDRWLEQLDSPFLRGGHTRWRAAIAAALGDRVGAVRLLEQAIQEGVDLGYYHHRDPEWEILRDYWPYLELMRPRG